MTTTIRKLREVYDAHTPGGKKFKKKHVTIKHDDRAGNKDDVFQATNVKPVARTSERHGYESGSDAAVYEAIDKDMQRKLQQQRMRDLGYSHPTKSGKWSRKGNPKVDVSKEKDGNLYDPALLLKKEEFAEEMSAAAKAKVAAWDKQKKQENVKRSIEYIKARLKLTKDEHRKAAYQRDLRTFQSMATEETDLDESLIAQYVLEDLYEEVHRPEHLKAGTSIRTKKMSMVGKVTKVEKHPAYGHAVYFQVGDGRTMRTPISNVQMVREEFEELNELSSDLLARYKQKARVDASAADKKGDFKTGDKRFHGIVKATKKQFANDVKKYPVDEEAEQIDELSRKTLVSYMNKASDESQKSKGDATSRSDVKRNKTVKAFGKAFNRVYLRKEETEQLDEYVNKVHKDHFFKALDASTLPQASVDKVKEHVKKHFSDVEHLIRPDMKNIARGTGVDETELAHHARLKEEVELHEEVLDANTVKQLRRSGDAMKKTAEALPPKHMDKWAIHHAGDLLTKGKVKEAKHHINNQDTACRDEIYNHIHPKHYKHFGVESMNDKRNTSNYRDTMNLARSLAKKTAEAKKKAKLKEETEVELTEAPLDPKVGEKEYKKAHKDTSDRLNEVHRLVNKHYAAALEKGNIHFGHVGDMERVHNDLKELHRSLVMSHEHSEKGLKLQKRLAKIHEGIELTEGAQKTFAHKEYVRVQKDVHKRIAEIRDQLAKHAEHAKEAGHGWEQLGTVQRAHSALKNIHHYLAGHGEYANVAASGYAVPTHAPMPHPVHEETSAIARYKKKMSCRK